MPFYRAGSVSYTHLLRLLRGQLYSRQLRDTGRVESWFTDCGARMGQDIEGFVANARQQYVLSLIHI